MKNFAGFVFQNGISIFFTIALVGCSKTAFNDKPTIGDDVKTQNETGRSILFDASSESFGNDFTFEREGRATFYGSDGQVKYAGPNSPRFAYHPNSLEFLGLLVEPESSNLLQRSQNLDDQAFYFAENSSVVGDVTMAPDGTMSADALVESDTFGSHQFFATSISDNVVPNTNYTFSIFVKNDTRTGVYIIVQNSDGTFSFVEFDLLSDLVSVRQDDSNTVKEFGIINLTNDWKRIWVTFDSLNGASRIGGQVRLHSGVAGQLAYQGDGVSQLFVWGNQLEKGSHPTSYIPTDIGLSVRGGDSLSLSKPGWLNPDSGTLSLKFKVEQRVSSGRVSGSILHLGGASNSLSVLFDSALGSVNYNFGNRARPEVQSSGANMATVAGRYSFAASYETPKDSSQTSVKFVEGSNSLIDGTAPNRPLAEELTIGGNGRGTGSFWGYINSLSYTPKASTEAELKTLNE